MKLKSALIALALIAPANADEANTPFQFASSGSATYDSLLAICGTALTNYDLAIQRGIQDGWSTPEPAPPYAETDRSLDLVRVADSPFSKGRLFYGAREQFVEAYRNKSKQNDGFDLGEIEFSEIAYPDIIVKSCHANVRSLRNDGMNLSKLADALVNYNGGFEEQSDDPTLFGDGGLSGGWSKNFEDRGVVTVDLYSGPSARNVMLSFQLIKILESDNTEEPYNDLDDAAQKITDAVKK